MGNLTDLYDSFLFALLMLLLWCIVIALGK